VRVAMAAHLHAVQVIDRVMLDLETEFGWPAPPKPIVTDFNINELRLCVREIEACREDPRKYYRLRGRGDMGGLISVFVAHRLQLVRNPGRYNPILAPVEIRVTQHDQVGRDAAVGEILREIKAAEAVYPAHDLVKFGVAVAVFHVSILI